MSAIEPTRPLRLYQCPGCWSWGVHKVPATDGYLECDCGERLDCIDLRGEFAGDVLTWSLHHPAPTTEGDDTLRARARQGGTTLLDKLAALSDDEWSELTHRLTKHFGRELAARGLELTPAEPVR